MYISSFHIDGFGLFTNVSVEEIPAGMTIFLGSNEAGKSTCLDFLRAMLTGFPEKHNNEQKRKYEPAPGVMPGGSLGLRYLSAAGIWDDLRLTRRPGRNGLTLLTAQGNPLPEDVLAGLLAGVSQEVYHTVFGFSLGELERFGSLSADGVRNALYGASFGIGLRSPAEALQAITKQKEEIYKPTGTKPPLNVALLQLEQIRAKIREQAERCTQYDSKALELENNGKSLEQLRDRKKYLENERRLLERRLGVWQQWDQWRLLNARLDRLPQEKGTIPEDAPAILASLKEALNSGEQHLAARREILDRLRDKLTTLNPDIEVLEELPALKRLSEHKNSYRQALLQIRGQMESCKRLKSELESNLQQLGPGWDCDRIRKTDRSLFVREDLEKLAREMNVSLLGHQAAMDYLGKANREVEIADEAFNSAKDALAEIPEADAALTDHERDELRQNMARLEESRRIEPGRERALAVAKDSFTRASNLANLQLPKQDDDEGKEEYHKQLETIFDNISSHQNEGFELAEEMRRHAKESEEAGNRLRLAEEKSDSIRRKIDDLRASRNTDQIPGREALRARTRAIHSLRTLQNTLESARERYSEIEARLNSEQPPQNFKNRLLLVFSIIFLLAGGGILGANWIWGITQVIIADTIIPLNLWTAYVALVCGFVLLAGVMPANSQARKLHRQHVEQLRNRRDAFSRQIADLEEQGNRLCAEAGVDSMDPITLEATEALLDREKEQCFQEEQTRKEMDGLLNDLNIAREKSMELQKYCQQKEGDVQKCRRHWQDLMHNLYIGSGPSPESATTVFARAESARLAFVNLCNSQKELDALWEDLHLLEKSISTMPAIAQKLENSPDTLSLETAVRQILEECREADLIRERKIHAKATLQTAQNDLNRAQSRQKEASSQLENADQRLAEANNSWAQRLEGFGLGENLAPETVREAFKFMENCLTTEERLQQAQSDLAEGQAQLDALKVPLEQMLAKLQRMPVQNTDGQSDWIVTLDELLLEAESARVTQDEKESLNKRIVEEEIGIGAENAACEKVTAKMNELFSLAGVENADDFLRMYQQHMERRELKSGIANLESSLSIAADNRPLVEFLDSFKDEDQNEQESRLADISNELETINSTEEELVTSVASLKAQLHTLSSATDMAALRQEESIILEDLNKMAFEWGKRAVAEKILRKAKNIFEKERQPEVIRLASDIFSQITNGRWRGINASLEDHKKIGIIPPHGEPVSPEYLSRGAQEQAYLALRLAYIRNHADHATSLPVIMDEILVNFDPERAERAAVAFARLSEGSGNSSQQILYFTCQPFMVDILKKASPTAPLYLVEKGTIHAA